ncbi:SUMO-specific isopeptidase USPL1 [Eucyclogobius newberryi]|uniref:SUMO-specific isopeptidase USPL1 n=1 Tax=Eucyclogobius newberryi TaxID=166745 RepID=UPI003B5C4E82
MVIFTDWVLSPVMPKSTCGLPMSGEDTGLEAVASPMVGYLGKVQERAASLDHCPWCHSKGLTSPLCSYRINLEESITLCTNPECLFPLVSRPLEDVLASLEPVEPATGNKRKKSQTLVANEPSAPSPKRPRLKELESSESQTCASDDGDVHDIVDACNGPPLDVEERADAHFGCSQTKRLDLRRQEDGGLDEDSGSCTDAQTVSLDTNCDIGNETIDIQEALAFKDDRLNGEDNCVANAPALDGDCGLPDIDAPSVRDIPSPAQTKATETNEPVLSADHHLSALSNIDVVHSETENVLFTETNPEEALVPAPVEVFWRNKDNLCWLDSLLVALVNLRTLRNVKPKDEHKQSTVWTLLAGYDEALAAVQSQRQTDKDGSLKIPSHLLDTINANLETLRMSFFNLLQPKLHCKLGQKETPVFALPLLVKLDCWLESSFQSTFYWDFRCSDCKSNTIENVVKTLPTFTNIVPDWHPLRAVHFAPCNNCHRKNQRRRMVLQDVPPVFALHFVEGLPDNNIHVYNFNFKKKHYFVSVVIQYSSQLKHFVTWVHKSDGSWVEFDDLKHPRCKPYETLPVPAQEIHVVFWEEEQRQESRACSPSTTFADSPPTARNVTRNATIAVDLSQRSPDQSLISPQNDPDVMDFVSEQDTAVTAGVDTSIGSTTLLDAFEGLTHNDIVTLTLVELEEDFKKPPSNSTDGAIEQAKEFKGQDVNNATDTSVIDACVPAPDSSSTGETMEKPQETRDGPSTESEPEENEEEDDFEKDPDFKLKSTRGRKRGRTVAKQVKKPKVDPPKGKVAIAKVSPVQSKPAPPPTSKPISSVSSTVPVPQNVLRPPPVTQPGQNAWSDLLERSLGHIQNKCNMNSNQKPLARSKRVPVHAAPPQQRNVVPPRPTLRTEDGGGLPLKAAGMYGAFGAKNATPNSTPQDKMPPAPPVQKAVGVVNRSPPSSFAGLATDIMSSKKTKSSKMPSGLSETELLRYKLYKKLQAKKKKLAKLNEMLGRSGDASFRPDSTNGFSPNTVTSSTLDEEFFSDFPSPATTVTSNLSPDSTDLLELLADGQEVSVGAVMSSNATLQPHTGATTTDLLTTDLLDEYMSRAVVDQPSEMEEYVFSELGLFL